LAFLYPGLLLPPWACIGVVVLFPGDVKLGASTLGFNTFIAACMAVSSASRASPSRRFARRYTTLRGLLPPSTPILARIPAQPPPERMLALGAVLFIVALDGHGYGRSTAGCRSTSGRCRYASVVRVFALR
jgi:hypothetical protein